MTPPPGRALTRARRWPYVVSMFFRRKVSDSGVCLQLLEAYRNAQGQPRQRVVVSLGDAAIPEAEQPRIAQAVGQWLSGQTELLAQDYSATARQWIDQIVKRVEREGRWQPAAPPAATAALPSETVAAEVLLDQISHTHTTPLGPSWVGWHAWQQLGLPAVLEALGFNAAQREAAAITVIHRLVDPGSERALLAWLPDSSLPELLGSQVTAGGKDRVYRISDRLWQHRAALEAHLRERTQSLFNLERTILLYDLTNSYFEGEALGNPKAKRGKSKEKRNDCPQIVLGMVFDGQGFELAHRVFEGNQSDSASLVTMLAELQKMLPAQSASVRPLVILDGGIATRGNLQALRDQGFGYLVNDTRRSRSRYREYFADAEEFAVIAGRAGKPAVQVRLLSDPLAPKTETAVLPDAAAKPVEAPDQLLLCKSQGRRDKEQAIYSQAELRLRQGLERLAKRVAGGKLKEPKRIERALGRLLGKHPRAQRFYEVEVRTEKPVQGARTARLVWQRRDAEASVQSELFGCYVLRTHRHDLSASALWELYMTLTRAEDGFKALKGDLGLRPNYHQTESRVEGHVFISVLAYHLLRYVLRRLEEAQEDRSWQTLKRILSTHCYTTLRLPTKGGTLYRVRKAGEPEEEQKRIYRILGMTWDTLPKIRMTVTANHATTL